MIRSRRDFVRIAFFLSLGLSSSAYAGKNKFDVNVGYFSVNAETQNSSGSISGAGLYQFNFRRALNPKLELSLGYTIYFTDIISGDSGSGLDVGANYFPFTAAAEITATKDGKSMRIEERFRPYIGISFNQRSYQSVQSSYSGFGVVVGAENSIGESLSVHGAIRYISLSGARNATASEMDVLAGVSFRF